MFMTRMALDINRPDTQQALANPSILQKAVEAAFNGVKVNVIWRVEQLNHRMHLLMLSPIRPTLHLTHATYGYPGAFPSWETWNVDDELNDLRSGECLHFRLCAATCPTMDQHERLPLMARETMAAQLAWLHEHCQQWGFTFSDADVKVLQSAWVTWTDPADEAHLLTTHQATFDGELTVTDPDRLSAAIPLGLGESTQMGAGLITMEAVQRYRYV